MMPLLLLTLAQAFTGNRSCAPCHQAIFESYQRTPMAQSSGAVQGDVPPGSFRHAASGTEFRVDARGASASRELTYFIGSGAAGRSYLYALDGFLFQAPITWYAQKNRWDMSPGYEADAHPLWNRAVNPKCLFCHASQGRPIHETENRYAEPPFLQAGVGCERCHGPGAEHVAGRAKMVNPAKLDPARRDSVCAQCHLGGEARVEKAGRSMAMYRPGELLADYASYFVIAGARDAGLKATSYVERFEASRCKQASGDRLWCASCHDPHSVPPPAQRADYFREKCVLCHQQAHQAASGKRDCAGCHMPREQVVDGGHGVLTDHAIPRKPRTIVAPTAMAWRLERFLGSGDAREAGLAYAEIGVRTGDHRQQDEAIRLLSQCAADAEVAVRLGDLLQRKGQLARAEQLYRSALQRPPVSTVALVNLGTILGSRGEYEAAISLWRRALAQNPGLLEASTNLARVLRALGRTPEAVRVEENMRRFETRKALSPLNLSPAGKGGTPVHL